MPLRRRRSIAVCALLLSAAGSACTATEGLVLGAPPVDAAVDSAADADAACANCDVVVVLDGSDLTAQQGGDGGTAYVDTCPGDEVVVGFEGFLTDPSVVGLTLVGAIQAMCSPLLLATSPVADAATQTLLPLRGMSQASAWSQVCPDNYAVVGFTGQSGIALDQVSFVCAPWSLGDGGVTGVLVAGAETTLAPVGGDGGNPYDQTCPSGEVARGTNVRAGEWIDAFGLVCGVPSAVADAS